MGSLGLHNTTSTGIDTIAHVAANVHGDSVWAIPGGLVGEGPEVGSWGSWVTLLQVNIEYI